MTNEIISPVRNTTPSTTFHTLSNETRMLLMEKQILLFAKNIKNGDGDQNKIKYLDAFTLQYAILLAQAGNSVATKWLNATLNYGMQLLDPVWGGMYDYSTNSDWVHPNYFKPLRQQCTNIRMYLQAYIVTGNKDYYTTAENTINYVLNYLKSPGEGFYDAQFAKSMMENENTNYYKLNDVQRKSQGIPLVDKNIYASSNGMLIYALTSMYMISANQSYLVQAIKTSNWIIKYFGTPDGGFRHTPTNNTTLLLRDTLHMGRAFLFLYMATTDTQYLTRAKQSLDFINLHFRNPSGDPGFIASIPDISKNKSNSLVTDAEENTILAQLAILTYYYTGEKKYLEIGQLAASYVTSPEVISKNSPAIVLLANELATTEPLKIIIIGNKKDKNALTMFLTALKFPSFYMIIHWYESSIEANQATGIIYPTLDKPAAFFCTNNSCSLPLYSPQSFDEVSAKIVAQQEMSSNPGVLASVTKLFPKTFTAQAQQTFANILINRNWLLIAAGFWFIGLLLAFTPCVLPLLMVLSTLLLSVHGIVSKSRMLLLALTYVLALALTYACMGYLAGASGIYLQIYLQSPILIISISVILAILAFSLLGSFKINLSPFLRHYFVSFNSIAASNTYIGAALMGIILTLLAAPCMVAPLVGVLSIIAEFGDKILGAFALFMMGLGLGTPVIFAGLSMKRFAPVDAEWQTELRTFFGLILLGCALWMSSRVISHSVYMVLLSVFVVFTSIYMGIFEPVRPGASGKLWKAINILVFIYGIGLMVGIMLGSNNSFHPLIAQKENLRQTYTPESIGIFVTIKNDADFQNILATAKQQNRPVLLDFSATWCESCNMIERDIFNNPEISYLMLKFILARVDLTARDSESLALAKEFNIVGPPAILFFDTQGNKFDTQFYGDINADEFEQTLTSILQLP